MMRDDEARQARGARRLNPPPEDARSRGAERVAVCGGQYDQRRVGSLPAFKVGRDIAERPPARGHAARYGPRAGPPAGRILSDPGGYPLNSIVLSRVAAAERFQ